MRSDRAGMTLIELVGAITIAGFVLLGAVLLLDGVQDTGKRIVHEAGAITADATAGRLLQQLLTNTFATFDTTRRFDGTERAFAFSTLCAAPQGWSTACRAIAMITTARESSDVRVRLDDARWRILRQFRGDARLRYFDADRGEWKAAWSSSAAIPAALAVILADDTLVYTMGPSRD